MIVLGLTGSIGMGKSTASSMFRAEGVPVFEADAAVHELYSGAAAPLIEEAFPGTVRDGVVDRKALSRAVFGNAEALRRLEAIVHPLVREAEARFIAKAQVDGHVLAVLDIPLLLEGVDADRCDVVAVVSAPADVQRARVLARHGMTAETFEAILARQMPDEEKRAKADLVIDTGTSLEDTRKAVQEIIGQFSATPDNAKEG
jgi:dephospho-CoA kinase